MERWWGGWEEHSRETEQILTLLCCPRFAQEVQPKFTWPENVRAEVQSLVLLLSLFSQPLQYTACQVHGGIFRREIWMAWASTPLLGRHEAVHGESGTRDRKPCDGHLRSANYMYDTLLNATVSIFLYLAEPFNTSSSFFNLWVPEVSHCFVLSPDLFSFKT